MLADPMPAPLPALPCQCLGHAAVVDGCVCPPTERMLRSGLPLTPAQRTWCLDQINSVEGYRRDDYLGCTDAQLAKAVLTAWSDYCRDKGLL